MTRTEILKKLISLADLNELDAKVFIEKFLNKLSLILTAEESLYLPELGFFQKKKSKEGVTPRLISFTSSGNIQDEILFPIPSQQFNLSKEIDSVFSISIDKYIIPRDINQLHNYDEFLQTTETQKHLEVKAEKIISYGERRFLKLEDSKPAHDFSNIELSDQVKPPHFDFPDAKVYTKELSDIEQISWDFGKGWENEIDEDALLDVEVEDKDVNSKLITKIVEEEEINWDFGRTFIDETDIDWDDKPKDSTLISDIPSEVLLNSMDKVSFEQKENEISISFDLTEQIENPKDDEGYEVVPSLTRELKIDLSEFESGTKIDEPESTIVNLELKSHHEEEFVEVKQNPKTKTILEEVASLDVEPLLQDDSHLESTSPGIYPQEENYEAAREYIPPQEKPMVIEKSGKGITLWSIISVVLALMIIALLYWKFLGIPKWLYTEKPNEILETKVTPTIIERDFSVPVTYPYNKKDLIEETEIQPVDTSSYVQPEQETENQPIQNVNTTPNEPNQKKENITIQKEPSNLSKVKDNIYFEGSSYVVQVSSWKAKPKADEEVMRLKRKGFNAFVTQVEIPGRGIWYRVKVGGFKSLQEAEQFANQK
jgi:cell division septation protein DedD